MEHWLACALAPTGDSDQHTAGRRLLRRLLAAQGWDGNSAIEIDAGGKPHLVGHPPRHISIAHSAQLAAAVVCRVGPVGIDIEAHNATRNWPGIAETYFGPRECALVTAQGLRAFYRIWTLREAIGKATGEGLLTDQADRVGDTVSPYQGAWISEDRQWLLAHFEPRPGLSLALAVQPRRDVDLGRWSLDSLRWPLGGTTELS